MKKSLLYLLLILCVLLINSCALFRGMPHTYSYLQVAKIMPASNTLGIEANSNGFVYNNDDLNVIYNMWAENGQTQFYIYNKSEDILYVNLAKSFFIKNGYAHCYSEENTLLAIPPMSTRLIECFQIVDEHILDCDLINYPAEKSTIKYDIENSPVVFANFLTYQVGDASSTKTLRHEFYISQVTNYVKHTVTSFIKRDEICNAVLTPTEIHNKKNNADLYDVHISVPTLGSFYCNYEVTSYDKLYDTKGTTTYYWNSTYGGYVVDNVPNTNNGDPWNFGSPWKK